LDRVVNEGQPRTDTENRSIRDVVEDVLTSNGFTKIVWGARMLTGFEATGRAIRNDGSTIIFDIAGGLTNVRPGLSRGDLLWRAIGRGAVIAELEPHTPFIIFTSGLPEKLSGGNALAMVVGPGRPIAAVIDVRNQEAAQNHPALGK
jgi:hypothetical protein